MIDAVADRLRSIRTRERPEELALLIPYNRFLGLTLAMSEGRLVGHLPFDGRLVGNPNVPALHGGVTGALLESISLFTLLWEQETVVLPKTISITISYLRPARATDTFARAHVTRRGRRVVSMDALAWQDDKEKPVAQCQAQFLVTDSTAAAGSGDAKERPGSPISP